jgi:hypothetical protein
LDKGLILGRSIITPDCGFTGDEMSYLILMNPSDNPITYLGAIIIIEGRPWYVTRRSRPTLFSTEKGAESIVKRLKKAYPEYEFISMSVEMYLNVVEGNGVRSEWLTQMKQEQMELIR